MKIERLQCGSLCELYKLKFILTAERILSVYGIVSHYCTVATVATREFSSIILVILIEAVTKPGKRSKK